MPQRIVEAGHRFAGRYVLEDLLEDFGGIRSWRATDDLLGRAVLIQTAPLADPRAGELATAARAAALCTDPRVLRVLDVSREDGHGYLVREWVVGTNLATLLAAGPLAPAEAGILACEVAQALTTAHLQGLSHRCLDPTSIVVSHDGAVRIVGLATRAVVDPPLSTDPARDDALGIGRVLYAALTGRWPGPNPHGLPPAPLVEGRLALPRQVRAGVPGALDDIVYRLLDDSQRPGANPIRTPAEAASALRQVCPPLPASGLRTLSVGHPSGYDDSPPALVTVGSNYSSPGSHETTVLPRATLAGPDRSRPRWSRLLAVLAGGAFLVGIVLLGLQMLEPPAQSVPTQQSQSPTASPSLSALDIERAVPYDPFGDGEENDRRAGNAIDGDAKTQWQTQTYFDPLEIQKPGVGLVLDLGEPVELREAQLALAGAGGALDLKVAPAEATGLPRRPEDWISIASQDEPTEQLDIAFDEPVTTRYVLIWFTKLPQISSGEWKAEVVEVRLIG